MDIIFYKLQDEVNDVKKTRTLTATLTYTPITVQGTLKSVTSKVTPSIEFSKPITYFSGYNYCYIADFNRYYFVSDMTSIRNDYTVVDLRVDVLTSFLTPATMRYLTGFVSRTAKTAMINPYIPDNRIQFKSGKKVTVHEPLAYSSSIANITFSNTATDNILISVTNTSETPTLSDITIPNDLVTLAGTSSISGKWLRPLGNVYAYVANITDTVTIDDITYNRLEEFLRYCGNRDNVQSFVNGVIVYPFSLPKDSTRKQVKIQSSGIGEVCSFFSCTKYNSGYQILKDFILTESELSYQDDFTKYEPYTMCEVFIPFVGWQTIDIKANLGCRLLVMYDTDYTSGIASVYLYNKTKEAMVYQGNAQLGIHVPVNTTNLRENELKDQNYTRNYIAGSLTGFAIGAAGAITGNYIAMAGGMATIVNTMVQTINNENLLLDRANNQVVSTSATSGCFGGLKVLVRWTQLENVNFNNSTARTNFIDHLGRPSNSIHTLSELIDSNNYHTYAEIVNLHTTTENGQYSIGDATYVELQELQTLCANGIYL